MIDPAAALALLAEEGWRTLVEAGLSLDEAGGDEAGAPERLARRLPGAPPESRAAAMELVAQGARLARKLGVGERLLAVREAVDRAPWGRVATWHAQQVPAGSRVLEMGCGCGGDSLALAHRAANLIATDADPVRAACTHVNLTTTGLATSRAIPGDGRETLAGEASKAGIVFVDPVPYETGGRSLPPGSWRPSLPHLEEIARGGRRVFVRAEPSLAADAVAGAFRVAYVSHGGGCVEAFLDSALGDGPAVRAVLLPDDGPSAELSGDRGEAPSGRVGEAVHVVDPSAVRAGLLAELCRRHGLRRTDPKSDLLTGPPVAASAWVKTFLVLRVLPLRTQDVLAELRRLRPSGLRIHGYGATPSGDAMETSWASTVDPGSAGPALVAFATRVLGAPSAILAVAA